MNPARKVVVRLMGGLGNQLFQYAAARALALDRDADLYLDIRWFTGETSRNFELDQFAIEANLLREGGPPRYPGPRDGIRPRLARRVGRLIAPSDQPQIVQESLGDDLHSTPQREKDVYLIGYWQSPHLFMNHWRTIRDELRPSKPLSDRTQELMEQMRDRTSVAVHVRRGDFVERPEIARIHHVCDPAYYSTAIARVVSMINQPTFFVFSDDTEWAGQHVRHRAAVYVDHPERSSYEDLMAMTACKAHIISNSTFGWWGAWLGQSGARGLVIAPHLWSNRPGAESPDLIPPTWIRL